MDETMLTYHLDELEITAGRIQAATEDRDEAITEALLAKVPVSKIAEATGLTRQRIWQIGRRHAPMRLG